jgi:hypothetical protein
LLRSVGASKTQIICARGNLPSFRWSTFWFYRNDHFGDRRALLMSPDGNDSWKLAETNDLK